MSPHMHGMCKHIKQELLIVTAFIQAEMGRGNVNKLLYTSIRTLVRNFHATRHIAFLGVFQRPLTLIPAS